MSDISLNFTWLDLLILAPIVGWPGLVIGAMLGVLLFWKRRRIAAGIVGAAIGCLIWSAATVFLN